MVYSMAICATGLSLTCLLSCKNYARAQSHRTALELVALILEAAQKNPATHCSLMKYTGTNYIQVKKYLELLTDIGFIETDTRNDKVSYEISVRGLAFLRQYRILRDMLLNAYYGKKPIDFSQESTIDPACRKMLSPICSTN